MVKWWCSSIESFTRGAAVKAKEKVVVTGGKTPGQQLDELIRLLHGTPEDERDEVASEWLAAMSKKMRWEPATVQAVAAAGQVAVDDPRAR